MSSNELTMYRSGVLRTSRYGQSALSRACEVVRSAPSGERNTTLFAAAVGIFELVAGGVVARHSAEQALTDAAIEAGLKPLEIRGALKSARVRGMQRPRKPPERVSFDAIVRGSPPPKPLPRRQPRAEPNYPPRDQVNRLWRLGRGVSEDDGASRWLRNRSLDPAEVDRFRLAKVISDGSRLPEIVPNTRGFGQWRTAPAWGLRVLFPLYDLKGQVRSLVFRRAFDMSADHPRVAEAPPKVLHTRGARRGLVMANSVARAILVEAGIPKLLRGAPLEVIVAEGEMDFLAASVEPHSPGTLRAVFGICSGSWRPEHARLIPVGSRVIVTTDQDPAGERYAAHVGKTFASTGVTIGRWRPHHKEQDLCDAGGLRGGRIDWLGDL